jgi:glyoxylate/hydroxypyruvate reductase A
MLDSDHLSHAVLDVFDKEPLDRNHRYWKHPDITIWPHVAAPTDQQSASTIVANNIEAYLSNGTIPASVDRKVQY